MVVSKPLPSSTVNTPLLPTFAKAVATNFPIYGSLEDIVAICSFSSSLVIFLASFSKFAKTIIPASSISCLSNIGL